MKIIFGAGVGAEVGAEGEAPGIPSIHRSLHRVPESAIMIAEEVLDSKMGVPSNSDSTSPTTTSVTFPMTAGGSVSTAALDAETNAISSDLPATGDRLQRGDLVKDIQNGECRGEGEGLALNHVHRFVATLLKEDAIGAINAPFPTTPAPKRPRSLPRNARLLPSLHSNARLPVTTRRRICEGCTNEDCQGEGLLEERSALFAVSIKRASAAMERTVGTSTPWILQMQRSDASVDTETRAAGRLDITARPAPSDLMNGADAPKASDTAKVYLPRSQIDCKYFAKHGYCTDKSSGRCLFRHEKCNTPVVDPDEEFKMQYRELSVSKPALSASPRRMESVHSSIPRNRKFQQESPRAPPLKDLRDAASSSSMARGRTSSGSVSLRRASSNAEILLPNVDADASNVFVGSICGDCSDKENVPPSPRGDSAVTPKPVTSILRTGAAWKKRKLEALNASVLGFDWEGNGLSAPDFAEIAKALTRANWDNSAALEALTASQSEGCSIPKKTVRFADGVGSERRHASRAASLSPVPVPPQKKPLIQGKSARILGNHFGGNSKLDQAEPLSPPSSAEGELGSSDLELFTRCIEAELATAKDSGTKCNARLQLEIAKTLKSSNDRRYSVSSFRQCLKKVGTGRRHHTEPVSAAQHEENQANAR
ncbi:hypothetical protein ACHAXT_011099, partial [Thalassiosira profunda]